MEFIGRESEVELLRKKIDAFYEKHPEKKSMKSAAKGLSLADL